MRRALWVIILLCVAMHGTEADDSTRSPSRPIRATLISDDVEHPVQIVAAPGNSDLLYIVERSGLIRIFKKGHQLSDHLLDIEESVSTKHAHGLVSLAFPHDVNTSKVFYVSFIDLQGDTIVARFPMLEEDTADIDTMNVVMKLAQAFQNSHGNQIAFGHDHYLYVSSGDGGGPQDNIQAAQRLSSLFGKMLRIKPESTGKYLAPSDNPFQGEPRALPEIWALGFRNPRYFSFDRETGSLLLLDEGVNFLEVNRVERGKNYGWPEVEGFTYVQTAHPQNTFRPPLFTRTMSKSPNDIIGGVIYRGDIFPELRGKFIFGISSLGELRALTETSRGWQDDLILRLPHKIITAVGEDSHGELYCATDDGSLFALTK